MMKKQITVGTCVQGGTFLDWVPALLDKGFECFTCNFHMTFGDVNPDELAPKAKALLDGTGIKLSALGYYCNALQYEEHAKLLHHTIDLASAFGTDTVSTFAGSLEGKSVEESMPVFKKVFGELAKHAEDVGVKLAIENCPMGGTWQKGTCNIGFCADAWDMMFNEVDSPALGLEWEPAHQMCQLIDPIANLRKYVKKVVHVHGKDATIMWDYIRSSGIRHNEFVESRFPGFGDTDWRKIFEILQMAGYEGCISIEGYHDPLFCGEWEYTGQINALNYLKQCRGNSFVKNPWDK